MMILHVQSVHLGQRRKGSQSDWMKEQMGMIAFGIPDTSKCLILLRASDPIFQIKKLS